MRGSVTVIDLGGPLRTTAAIVFGALGLYLAFNLVRARDAGDPSDVATEATQRTAAGLSAMMIGVTTVFIVVTSSADALLAQGGELVAMFPSQIANLGLVGLGALGVSGVVDMSWPQFIAIALVLLGIIAVVRR